MATRAATPFRTMMIHEPSRSQQLGLILLLALLALFTIYRLS